VKSRFAEIINHWRHWLLLLTYSLWEHWLGKTKRIVANSTWELVLWILRRKKMEPKDIKLGDAGDLSIALAQGKATVSISVAAPGAALSASASLVVDAGALVDKLEAAVEKAYPAGAPIEAAVFAVLKKALVEV
jgi:hypothetical protein